MPYGLAWGVPLALLSGYLAWTERHGFSRGEVTSSLFAEYVLISLAIGIAGGVAWAWLSAWAWRWLKR